MPSRPRADGRRLPGLPQGKARLVSRPRIVQGWAPSSRNRSRVRDGADLRHTPGLSPAPGRRLGAEVPASGRCCWPGQTYDRATHHCEGTPACPSPFVPEGSEWCSVPGSSAATLDVEVTSTNMLSDCLIGRDPPVGGVGLLVFVEGERAVVRADVGGAEEALRCLEGRLSDWVAGTSRPPTQFPLVWLP